MRAFEYRLISMKIIFFLALGFTSAYANPIENDIPAVEPEYLSALLREGKYEEFSALLNIPDPELVKERNLEGRSEDISQEAMFNKGLIEGDIVPYTKFGEEGRQVINSFKYTSTKWPKGKLAYVIHNDSANNNFTEDQRKTIQNSINRWNDQLRNFIELVPRKNEESYVFVFSGGGCWSFLGKIGKQQGLSLQYNGCLHQRVILHEFQHAIGFHHEQNRLDRDEYVEVLWNNIPKDWHPQYQKTDTKYYFDIRFYDYYSIMHYSMKAPGTDKDAFKIKKDGIDKDRIGRTNDFTSADLEKIKALYKCKD